MGQTISLGWNFKHKLKQANSFVLKFSFFLGNSLTDFMFCRWLRCADEVKAVNKKTIVITNSETNPWDIHLKYVNK